VNFAQYLLLILILLPQLLPIPHPNHHPLLPLANYSQFLVSNLVPNAYINANRKVGRVKMCIGYRKWLMWGLDSDR